MTLTKGTPEYRQRLARWATLTRASDERGLTVSEGAELRDIARQLHAAERTFAGLTDDYDEALRNANHLGTVEL